MEFDFERAQTSTSPYLLYQKLFTDSRLRMEKAKSLSIIETLNSHEYYSLHLEEIHKHLSFVRSHNFIQITPKQ